MVTALKNSPNGDNSSSDSVNGATPNPANNSAGSNDSGSSNINTNPQGNNNNKQANKPKKTKSKPQKSKTQKGKNKPFKGQNNNNNVPNVNPKAYKTLNLSTALVATKFYNRNLVSMPFRNVYDETVVLEYKVEPINSRLILQANSWAKKIISQQELYLKAILNSTRTSSWEPLLMRCYIYSYYKAVLYALTDRRVAEIPDNMVSIYGHSILYQILLRPSFNFEYGMQFVKILQSCTDAEYQTIISRARQFDYLDSIINESPRFYMENAEFDRILSGLSAHAVSDTPQFTTFGNLESISRHLTKDNFPLLNSIYSSSSNIDKWYYMSKENCSLMDSTTLFGKACFITAKVDTLYNQFFDLNVINDNDSLVKYEVSALCGSNYPNPDKQSSGK